jgi:hypothetical protein
MSWCRSAPCRGPPVARLRAAGARDGCAPAPTHLRVGSAAGLSPARADREASVPSIADVAAHGRRVPGRAPGMPVAAPGRAVADAAASGGGYGTAVAAGPGWLAVRMTWPAAAALRAAIGQPGRPAAAAGLAAGTVCPGPPGRPGSRQLRRAHCRDDLQRHAAPRAASSGAVAGPIPRPAPVTGRARPRSWSRAALTRARQQGAEPVTRPAVPCSRSR